MISSFLLTDFLKRISNDVAKGIRNTARRKNLGSFIGKQGHGGDRTNHGDQLAERLALQSIRKHILILSIKNLIVVSEEFGIRAIRGSQKSGESLFCIMDPVDGSCNLRPSPTPSPFVGFSLAIGRASQLKNKKYFGSIETALIRDIFHGDTWFASQGKGAYFINPHTEKSALLIKSSRVKRISDSIIGMSIDRTENILNKLIKSIYPLLEAAPRKRRVGSTVLDLARVSSGEYDAYLGLAGGIKIHDLAAAQLIIKEAGGVVNVQLVKPGTDLYLQDLIIQKKKNLIRAVRFRLIAAGNQELMKKILAILKYQQEYFQLL